MKKFRKIVTDRPLMSDAEISATKKGFNEIVSKFQSTFTGTSGGFSIGGWTIGILSTAILGTSIWYASSQSGDITKGSVEDKTTLLNDSIVEKSESINPPFADKLTFEYFTVNNKKDVEIVTKNKNVLKIPANAFIDKDGKTVNKNVIIKFNDYHNPIDIFLSGIPMAYDSAGTNYTFETAGMFQIFAENKSGEKLRLNPGKNIEIDMNSKSVNPANIYYYDTIQNSWIYKSTESKSDIKNLAKKAKEIDKQIEDYTYEFNTSNSSETNWSSNSNLPSQQIAAKATEKRKGRKSERTYILKLRDKNGENKLIEIYPHQGFKDEYYSVAWTSTDLTKSDGGDYQVTLKKGNTILNFLGKESDDAEKKNIQQQIEKQKSEKQIRLAKQKELSEKIGNLRILQNNFNELTGNGFYGNRGITINDLGTWNCDRPVPYPAMAQRGNCTFVDDSGHVLRYASIQISQIDQNILWRYPWSKTWFYSGKSENILWFVTPENKVAILYPDKFKDMQSNKQVAVTVMEVDKGLSILKSFYN